jgi:hypothetical protein
MSNETKKTSVHADLEKLEGQITFNKRVAWILVGLGGLALGYGLWIFRNDLSSENSLSSIGSYFQGAVGSLWALAGLMFIYVAFLGQKQQLLLQREAMEQQEIQFKQEQANKINESFAQAEELQRQRHQFALQQESIRRQTFESAFFQLLNLHNQNVVQLRGTINGIERHGRVCFSEWYVRIFQSDFPAWLKRNQNKDAKTVATASEYYLSFYATNRANFAHYFRTLYHIFKFVKFGEIPDNEKKRYASLTRAQLSANELAFLFYNGISPYGLKFKPLIEEFGLLEHLDEDKLLDSAHKSFYDPKAFK